MTTIHEDTGADVGKRKRTKKEQVFEILNADTERSFQLIDKRRLNIPVGDYQRDESQGKLSMEISMHFCWVSFGVLTVIERKNGVLVVADGGTRLSAAMRRDDVLEVPCMVARGLTDKEEADVFLRINNNRRRLQILQLHHAELFSEKEIAVRAQELMDRLHGAKIGFESTAVMRKNVKAKYAVAALLVDVLEEIAVDRHVSARVMKGLFRFEVELNRGKKSIRNKPIYKKLVTHFGLFDAAVNAVVQPRSMGNSYEMAKAIARTLRIRLPKETE